jgi:hypothetical protein
MKRKWMSHLLCAVASAALMLAFASSARAQGYQDAEFDKFLSNHPGVANDLHANPGLINDPAFRAQHPELQQYLQSHQRVSATVRGQAAQMNGVWGAYDEHHQWHNEDWWRQNNPAWVQQYHPDWAANHPAYANNNPAYNPDQSAWDAHRHSGARQWSDEHHPDWVKKNHPNW